jgi:protein-S-isoprenylcysteine O-methyltransferase Ste14
MAPDLGNQFLSRYQFVGHSAGMPLVNPHEGTKGWDKVLLGLFFLTGLATIPVAALDDGRFHWSVVPWWACLVGYALLLAGMALLTWVQAVNKFFEPTVRIQTDRGQQVIDSGRVAPTAAPDTCGGRRGRCGP